MAAVGIDLGALYSCVGVWQNGQVEIIPNDQGNRTTPSYVAFTDTEILIGDAAINQISMNPCNTIFGAKRLIGSSYNDVDLQHDINYWPFRVVEENGKLYIRVEYKGKRKNFAAEEILSMVLVKMKETAEDFLKTPIKDAVITVPARFNDSQRQAIKDAGLIAGLNVLRIINGPTAAAMTFGLKEYKRIIEETNVLVFDLGGCTCDVSLVTVEYNIFEVKAVAGDNHLGGENFSNRLVRYFKQEFQRKFNKDLNTNPRALCRLKMACERAKRALSSSTQTTIEIDSLFDGIDFYTSLTRTKFEELNQDLFQSAMEPIGRALSDARIDKSYVHEIILVGGSTRIPKIQKIISEFFDGKEPNKSVNPDEAATYGAAVQASILSGKISKETDDLLLLDVAAFTIGIDIGDGVCSPVIKRNSAIPTKKSEIFTNHLDNQTDVLIKVYEGERARAKDNYFLGKFELMGISPAPKGDAQIEVTLDIDANGILKVSAVDKTTGRSSKITINNERSRLSKEEIDRMTAEVEMYSAERRKIAQKIQARNCLENYAYNLRSILQDVDTMKIKLESSIQESITWLENDQEAKREEYIQRQKSLEKIVNQMITKLYGTAESD